MIKHLVIDQARRWLSDPHNRDRLKKAGRSAWQAYQDSRRQREPGHGPGDAPRGMPSTNSGRRTIRRTRPADRKCRSAGRASG